MKKVQVVVTLGGMFEMDIDEKTSAQDVIEAAAKNWNLDLTQTLQPFVVSSNVIGKTNAMVEQEPVIEKLGVQEGGMLRAVMPLKPKE